MTALLGYPLLCDQTDNFAEHVDYLEKKYTLYAAFI